MAPRLVDSLLRLALLAAGCTGGSSSEPAEPPREKPATLGPAAVDAGSGDSGPRVELGPCLPQTALLEERIRPQQLIADIQTGGRLRPLPGVPVAPAVSLAAADAALRGRRDPLRRCIAPDAAGVAAVVLSFDAKGAVSHVRSDALDSRLPGCLDDAVRPARVPPGQAFDAVCPLAYGRLHLDRLPAVAITDAGVLLDGKPVVSLPLPAGAAPLAPLQDALQARAARRPGRAQGMVSPLDGRLYVTVQPAAATSSRLLEQLIAVLRTANAEPIFMTHERGRWVSLVSDDLPRPPFDIYVPALTHSAVLSILVSRGGDVLLGTGVLGETTFSPGHRGAPRLKALADTLAAWWAAPPFAPPPLYRRVAEIAGNDVDYATLVAVIRTATTAGFTDWELTDSVSIDKVMKH